MSEFILRPAPLCRLAVIFLLGLVLSACGGSSGGSIVYDGLTTQATVTDGNAGALSGGAYQTGDAGTSVSAPIAGVATGSATPSTSARSVRIATVVQDALSKVDMQSSGAVQATGASAQQSIDGTCGGSASYSVSYNETTGSFSGNFNFKGYCEGGETISGSMAFSGLLNIATQEFISFDINVNNLSVSNGSDSFAIAGSIDFAFQGTDQVTVTETFNIRDAAGKVYRVENYTVTINTLLSTVELHGRFFHPDYGYVDVVTTEDFVISSITGFPQDGSLTITGVNSGARLSATGGGNYLLEIDADGTPGYETSQPGLWSSL